MPLMLWLSPAFPVGAFAYSHGLEWAVEAGDIHDARSLGGWLVDLLSFGAPRADAILFAAAYRSAEAGDWPALFECNALAVALAPSAERRLETTAQGAAFVTAARASWDCEPLRRLAPAERDRLSGRGRRRRRGPWPAARGEPSGVRAGARRQRRLRRRAARADWPDRRPKNPGRAPAATSRPRARGGAIVPRRSRRLRLPLRHRQHASRNPIFEAFPLMRKLSFPTARPFSPCGRRWPEGPDEGFGAVRRLSDVRLTARTPHPQPLSLKGRGGSSLPRNRTDLP